MPTGAVRNSRRHSPSRQWPGLIPRIFEAGLWQQRGRCFGLLHGLRPIVRSDVGRIEDVHIRPWAICGWAYRAPRSRPKNLCRCRADFHGLCARLLYIERSFRRNACPSRRTTTQFAYTMTRVGPTNIGSTVSIMERAVSRSTLAPARTKRGATYSASLWLMPSRQGQKIIAAGAQRAR